MLDFFEIFKDVKDAEKDRTLTDDQKRQKLVENDFFLFGATDVSTLGSSSFIHNLHHTLKVKYETLT